MIFYIIIWQLTNRTHRYTNVDIQDHNVMINENLSDKAEKNLKNKTKFGENNGRPK